VDEKGFALVFCDREHDGVKGQGLLLVEGLRELGNSIGKVTNMVVKLIMEKEVAKMEPIMLREWDGREVLELLAHPGEDPFNEVETIVIDLKVSGIRDVEDNEFMRQVITEFGLVSIPQSSRLGRVVVEEDGGKERTELRASLHLTSLSKALVPFTIILQETPCKAGSLVGWELFSIVGAQVLPGSGPLDNSEQHPEIEALSSRWMGHVHATYGKAFLPWLPAMGSGIPDKVLREVLVEEMRGQVRELLIGFEPLCQVSELGSRVIKDSLRVIMLLEVHSLLILQVNRKTTDSGELLVHVKLKDVPTGLDRTNIAGIYVILDLIHISNLDSGTVRALVDVLVDVLDSLDRSADLDIDVAVILGKEPRVVGNNILVGEDMELAMALL